MSSLTSPSDKTSKTVFKKVNLSDDEVEWVMQRNNKDIRYTQVEQHYSDPAQINQKIALVSFIPSKGAKPDKDNIYGMMKVRGVYASEEEANQRAEFLIRNVDSYHDIFHVHVGLPFPCTTSEMYSGEIKQIDIRQKTTDIISEDILTQKKNERQQVEEIKAKEKRLLEESKSAQKNEPLDDFEQYITEQVKRAQLIWTYVETQKKLEQMKDSIQNTTSTIVSYDEKHPDFFSKYKTRYYEARKEAGLPDDTDDNSFIKYLGMDLKDVILQ